MTRFFLKHTLASFFIIICLQSLAFCFDGVVICNSSVTENSLTQSEIKDIYTWNKTRWGDGSKITFVILKEDIVSRPFFEEYLGMSLKSYKRFVKNQIFTNSYSEPKSFKTEKQVLQYVSETKGAIGFLSKEPDTWLVKPIVVK